MLAAVQSNAQRLRTFVAGFADRLSRQVMLAALVIGGALVISFVHEQWEIYEGATSRAERSTRNSAQLIAQNTARTLDAGAETLRVVDRLREDVAKGQFSRPTSIHAHLNAVRRGSPVLSEIAWFDADGERVASSSRADLPPLSVARETFFQVLKSDDATEIYIASPQRVGSTWQIGIYLRLENADGSFAGVAGGTIDPDEFSRIYRSLDLGPGASLTLFRYDGTVLAHEPQLEGALGRLTARTAMFRHHIADGVAGTYDGPDAIDGRDVIAGIAGVRGAGDGLVVAVSIAQSAIAAEIGSRLLLEGLQVLLEVIVLAAGAALLVTGLRRREKLQADLAQAAATARAAREEAEQASRTKSEFLANMSHELRTPLNAVIGFADLIEQQVRGPVAETYREYARDIGRSGEHLLGIINDILDLSKVEAGKLELHEEEIALTTVFRGCIRLIEPKAKDAGLSINMLTPLSMPALWADETRLKQILINLLSNAVKFTPRGGRIGLSAAVTSDSVAIMVTDTGIGMAPHQIPMAFESFRQIESAHSRNFEGTGLGLPLARRLTELHGGTLELESTPGRGTTATVRLPIARTREARATA